MRSFVVGLSVALGVLGACGAGDDDGVGASSCECSLTLDGDGHAWSACGESKCVDGASLVCTEDGLVQDGACGAGDDEASDEEASDDEASDDEASDDEASDDEASDDESRDDEAGDDGAGDGGEPPATECERIEKMCADQCSENVYDKCREIALEGDDVKCLHWWANAGGLC